MCVRPAGAKTGEGIETLHDVSERAMLDHQNSRRCHAGLTVPAVKPPVIGWFCAEHTLLSCLGTSIEWGQIPFHRAPDHTVPSSITHEFENAPLAALTPVPSVDILLPSKERFGPANAGAVSTVVYDLATASRTPGCFHVFGAPVSAPFEGVDFTALSPRRGWLHGNNIGLANGYLHNLRGRTGPDLVEVHGRCQVAAHIKAKRPDLKVALYLHNDPREMKASRTVAERTRLLRQMAAVICVSDYIRSCFLDGLEVADEMAAKVQTARNGVMRRLTKPVVKHPMVLLVGRMVPEKGILECAEALARTLVDHPQWAAVIVGGRHFKTAAPASYEAKVAAALAPLADRARMTGFLPLDEVRSLQEGAAIIACPSLWQEPMGKTALEALAVGSALLTTRRGGIPEAAEGRAHIVDEPSVDSFAAAIQKMVTDDAYRERLQKAAWEDFPFTNTAMARDADSIRAHAIATQGT